MLHKIRVKWVFITFVCIFINACMMDIENTRPPLTDEELAEINLQLGARYLEMNMLSVAKEKLKTALELDSNNAGIYNTSGVLHERLQQHGIAREYYKKAMSLDANNASIKNNYGRYLCESGDYQAGMELLKSALAMPLNNRKWLAYTNIGNCDLKQGNQELAEDNFRQALQISRSFSPALFEMQKISYHTGKYMSARAFLERYLAVARHTPETLWVAVQTERALGNQELAEEYRETLYSLFPTSKEAQQLKMAIR
jgi:type IV pilus assembly protein PilF